MNLNPQEMDLINEHQNTTKEARNRIEMVILSENYDIVESENAVFFSHFGPMSTALRGHGQ